MSTSISIFVLGDPKGQPRPRAFAIHGRARVYDPGTAEGWKSQIAVALRPGVPTVPFNGPLLVRLVFVFRRPQSHLRKNGDLSRNAPRTHLGRPDADNCAKAVLDACTTLRIWRDDAQIVDLHVAKCYAEPGEPSGAHVTIEVLDQA
jgi:Holliday junction resolvase RusA-like endonuclease